MPKFRIDDRELTVPEGTTVLQAALAAGIEIPHYCYHPGLSIAGNCRICLVEVEQAAKPVIACNTVATEGMVVRTRTERVRQLREAVMEFLLINHPLDCPICDQAGECKLQDYAYRYGRPGTRFVEEKEHGPKRRALGPHVVFDWERCIKCTRCIRFCTEVTGAGELGMFLRGVREEIGVFPGRPLDNPYSGNVVDLCPVGALTLRDFRFRSRVWFLTNTPSTCPGCARGCSVELGVFRNELLRITPRPNQAVNRWWICDVGRLWGRRLAAAEQRRLSGPRGGVQGAGDSWAGAVAAAAELLRAAAAAGRVRVLASPRATLEDVWRLAKLAVGPLAGAPVHLPAHEAGADDALLIRRERAPNARGAHLVLDALTGGARPVQELEQALRAGTVEALLAIGPGLVGPTDDEPPALAPETLARARALIAVDAHASPLSDGALVVLPAAGYGEFQGTYINFAGRIQHVAKPLTAKADCRPLAVILSDLWVALGGEPPPPARSAERLSGEVGALGGVRWSELPGSTGQDLPGVDAGRAAPPATGALVQMLAAGVTPAGER